MANRHTTSLAVSRSDARASAGLLAQMSQNVPQCPIQKDVFSHTRSSANRNLNVGERLEDGRVTTLNLDPHPVGHTMPNMMSNGRTWQVLLAAVVLCLVAMPGGAADLPARPAMRALGQGVTTGEVTLEGGGKVWIYLPEGQHAAKSLACVLVAPAGSNGITGMKLSDGDRDEQVPYVKAGFAVVSYELDGAMPNGASDRQVIAAFKAFWKSNAGTANAAKAIEYITARVPEIDPSRLYAAGHSSAGTHALLLMAADPRIRACAAFAPVADLRARLGADIMGDLEQMLPGAGKFIDWASPASHPAQFKGRPVFLFSAADDDNVQPGDVQKFADALKAAGANVEMSRVEKGGHYDSMIQQGQPMAIEWFKKVDAQQPRAAGQ